MYKFPKEKRLLKSREFKRTLDTGSKFILPELVVFSRKNEHPTDRMGLVVTKKIGNAVARNRVKRLLREVFRHSESPCEKPSLDLVLIARHKVKDASYEKLTGSFAFAMKHITKRYTAKRKKEASPS